MKNFGVTVLFLSLLGSGCATQATIKATTNVHAQNKTDFERAQKYYDLSMLSEAEVLFKKVLKNTPELDEAALRLGNIYVRTGQLEAAVLYYRQCTTKNPNNYRCWNNLSLVRVKQAIATLEDGQKSFNQGSVEQENLIKLHDQLVIAVSGN